eukprot:CAMPEP_0176131618 /NCGR_PEP_ID=MMETSP0120_2-20121206/66640_1 /TAXON_ID=160619 /ORGANISM="Kryptoperidinium foliaceum, Strain CCMP 1326" /LENGTH=47 /DNA_ID= /DNA_START= /DNA_END= /DNA_ORIENTATION=
MAARALVLAAALCARLAAAGVYNQVVALAGGRAAASAPAATSAACAV